jgi:hypothetical protein
MPSRPDARTWKTVLAAGLVLRPILIVPMAPSGPLGGSSLLPVGLALVFALSILLAAGVFVADLAGLAVAFGTFTALAGVVVAAVGAYLGLPMPWPLALAVYNIALAVVGMKAWRELGATPGG